MKNLLLVLLTMAVVTSCIAPRIVTYQAVPNATVLEAKCDGNAYEIVGRDMVLAGMAMGESTREFGQLRARTKTENADLSIIATIIDSCYVEFSGSVHNGGYTFDIINSKHIMKIGWNELVYVTEAGSCKITGSKVR